MKFHSPGLFITGTSTEVGKTYVAARIAQELLQAGKKVGVYKPVASGCRWEQGRWISEDAVALWEAAGRPQQIHAVCPQQFRAPLAPPLAAAAEGRTVNSVLLRQGLAAWDGYDVVVVEGAGGFLSPISEQDLVADLAQDLAFPVVIVASNQLGVINHTLLTAEACQRRGLKIVAVVLNDVAPPDDATRQDRHDGLPPPSAPENGLGPSGVDLSCEGNQQQLCHWLGQRCELVVRLRHQATSWDQPIDWARLAASPEPR